MSDNTYFASKEANLTAATLLTKANIWYTQVYSNGYFQLIRNSWMTYHGTTGGNGANSHKINFVGEQGELVQISINHYRNIASHILTMITANRPAFQARATNTDYKSLVQAKLANNLLDYYMREKRMEKYLRRACEYAVVFGSGFIKMEWNATSGETYDVNDETGVEIREGDVEFTTLSPYDVVFDTTKETTENQDWVVCRSFKNKFDLAAKFPEMGDKLKGMQTKSDLMKFKFETFSYDETDDIAVYEFFHRKTESMPNGRYLLFADSNLVMMDGPMPYRSLPVYRIAPSDILGTPYGYTPMFDLLPIQEAVNSLYSTVLTNQHAFGVQNVYVPRGADISFKSLEGGLNIVEGNAAAGKPEAMNLTSTPPEVFNFIKMLEQQMETISGVNSVARGNPEASLKSGTALALVQSMALQFISGLQQQYVQLIEDVGTGLINILKDFAAVPRIAMIAGKSNRSYIEKEFTGDDLSQVNRVIVDMGNPVARCLAKGTEVLMYNGNIKKVEDIVLGDLIMGPDSKHRTVNNINTGNEMMYEVTSKDTNLAIKYGCNESHILTLKYCSDDHRYNVKKGDVIDISIKEYNKLPARQQRILMGFKTGVEFNTERNYEIPPYILGAWLGDGHSDCTALTTADPEILKEWTDYAHSLGMHVRVSTNDNCGNAKIYFITSGEAHGKSDRNKMMNELKSMEVYKNKHVPKYYLSSPRSDRLQLLAGLLDTDGTLTNLSTFVFTQKSPKLSSDVVFLARSLGFRVSCVEKDTNSSELTGPISGKVNIITIAGNVWEIPTRLPRKQAQPKEKPRNWLNYGINVVAVGGGEYFGFTLAEEPHFVLGDFSVTHNTTAGKMQMATELIQYNIIKTPEQYMNVLTTGQLDVMTDDTQNELFLIQNENEKLSEGQFVKALAVDQHIQHIKGHKSVLSDPDLRMDDNLTDSVLAHIQDHINLLRNTDPALLALIGEQALGPAGGTPPNAPNPNEQVNQSQSPDAGPMEPPQNGAPPPGMPNMPSVPPSALPNPELQQQSMGNVK